MLKAVVFDLDDTLIDWSTMTEGWDALTARRVPQVYDYLCGLHPMDNMEAFVAEFRTRSMAAWAAAADSLRAPNVANVLVESAVAVGVPPHKLDARQCMEAYGWSAVEGILPFPEVIDVLTQLRDHGVRLGIITNAYQPMWARDVEIATLGLAEFFPDCRFSAADWGYLKPHPSIFQAALDCLEARADEVVFVGDDMEADIGGAKQTGIYAVLRTSPHRHIHPHHRFQPDSVISSLTELPAILDAQFPGWRA